MKKKIIPLMLVFLISFYSVSSIQEKRADASISVAVAMVLMKAGVSAGAFATFYELMAVNGYHMQISDAIVMFANKYYDKIGDTYIAKGGKVTVLEQMQNRLWSALAGEDAFTVSDLKRDILTDFVQNVPTVSTTIPGAQYTQSWASTMGISPLEGSALDFRPFLQPVIPATYNGPWQYDLRVTHDYQGMVLADSVWNVQASFNDYVNPNDGKTYGAYDFTTNLDQIIMRVTDKTAMIQGLSYPLVEMFFPNGATVLVPLGIAMRFKADYVRDLVEIETIGLDVIEYQDIHKVVNSVTVEYSPSYVARAEAPYYPSLTAVAVPDSFAFGSLAEPVVTAPTYLDLLNAQGKTIEGLREAIETDEALQTAIFERLATIDANTSVPVAIPLIDATTGIATYPVAVDVPVTVPVDTTIPGWLERIWGGVVAIPRAIENITDISQTVPMEQIDFSKLNMTGFITKFPFSIPFDFVHVLTQFRRSPIAPDLNINLDTNYLKLNHTIDIAPLNKYIVFFRWFMLMGFMITLMMLTHKVIRW